MRVAHHALVEGGALHRVDEGVHVVDVAPGHHAAVVVFGQLDLGEVTPVGVDEDPLACGEALLGEEGRVVVDHQGVEAAVLAVALHEGGDLAGAVDHHALGAEQRHAAPGHAGELVDVHGGAAGAVEHLLAVALVPGAAADDLLGLVGEEEGGLVILGGAHVEGLAVWAHAGLCVVDDLEAEPGLVVDAEAGDGALERGDVVEGEPGQDLNPKPSTPPSSCHPTPSCSR